MALPINGFSKTIVNQKDNTVLLKGEFTRLELLRLSLGGDRTEVIKNISVAVRKADEDFNQSGGSSRHWVRDCFVGNLLSVLLDK